MINTLKTVGDLRKLIGNLDDDFKLDIRIMNKVSEEELIKRRYPYPWDMNEGVLEFHDIGWSDKELCIGAYIKDEYED